MAARHRPCRHRHADGRRAPARWSGRQHRRDIGREAFLEHVWAWKEQSGGTIVNQLKRLGASCDWSRERFTMDEGLSDAVRRDLRASPRGRPHLQGQASRQLGPQALDGDLGPRGQQVEVNGPPLALRLPAGRRRRPETGEVIVVATTRPETMLGDTAVAVHPEDERYSGVVGSKVACRWSGAASPSSPTSYSDPEKGTGAVKMTPAHDFNDFEVGRRHGLDDDQHLRCARRWPERGGCRRAPIAVLDRFEARKRVVARLEAAGLLVAIEPHTHTGAARRPLGRAVEPWLTDQWYVDVKPLAERPSRRCGDGETRFVPANWEKTFFDWLENILPGASRASSGGATRSRPGTPRTALYSSPATEWDARAKAHARFGREVALKRDEDVLDTWFSSALWPFSTLGWPEETPELEALLSDLSRWSPASTSSSSGSPG